MDEDDVADCLQPFLVHTPSQEYSYGDKEGQIDEDDVADSLQPFQLHASAQEELIHGDKDGPTDEDDVADCLRPIRLHASSQEELIDGQKDGPADENDVADRLQPFQLHASSQEKLVDGDKDGPTDEDDVADCLRPFQLHASSQKELIDRDKDGPADEDDVADCLRPFQLHASFQEELIDGDKDGPTDEDDVADCLRPIQLHASSQEELIDGDKDGPTDEDYTADCIGPIKLPASSQEKLSKGIDVPDALISHISSKDGLVTKFLKACSIGELKELQNDIIPEIKKMNYDVRDMTNDQYFSATGLHLAVLDQRIDVANLLMEEFGNDLIVMPYTHPENKGLTALHIAITHGLNDLVDRMLRDLPDTQLEHFIHAECSGSFFQKKWNISSTPLTLAVLCNNAKITEILLKYGADPCHRSVECNGETILHAIARHSLHNPGDVNVQLKMLKETIPMDRLLKMMEETFPKDRIPNYCDFMEHLLKIENYDGITPLIFCLKIGASEAFQALMEIPWVSKFPQWNYNPMQLDYYDVTVLKQKQPPWNISGLEVLAFNANKMLQLYKTEPIKTLVNDLWHQYRLIHIFGGLIHLVYMALISVGALSKHFLKRNVLPIDKEELWVTLICLILLIKSFACTAMSVVDIFIHVSPLWVRKQCIPNPCNVDDFGEDTVALESFSQNDRGFEFTMKSENEVHVTKRRKNKNTKQCSNDGISLKLLLRGNTMKVNFFILNFFVFIWCILRLAGNQYEATVAVMPLIIGWYSCILYTMSFRKVFIFLLMLNNMLMSNVLYFSVALLFILIGFGTAFYSLLDPLRTDMDQMFPFTSLLNTLIRQMLALNDIDELMDDMRFPIIARLVMFIFFVVATVLLLNTLLASMTDTYSEVKDNKEALWYRAKLQMALETEQPSFRHLNCLVGKSRKIKIENKKYYLEVHMLKKAM